MECAVSPSASKTSLNCVWTSDQITSIGMSGDPPLLRKYLKILRGVPSLVWTSDLMLQIGMCGVTPPLILKILVSSGVSLTQLVSPSVALPAELVIWAVTDQMLTKLEMWVWNLAGYYNCHSDIWHYLFSQPQRQHNLNTAVGLDMKMTLHSAQKLNISL